MRQITSSTLSNQSLVTALLTHTYTADGDREIFFRLFADQVAGNGVYTAYVTIQRLGAGSFYEVQPRTSPIVASGITSVAFTTIPIPVKNTDVVKVYLIGLAGDTTTPDIITEVWKNDDVVDVLTMDTYAQPGQEAPAAAATLAKIMAYCYKFLRNRLTETATELKVYADDGITVDQKAPVSDDGTTYVRGEIGSGP